MRNSSRDSNIQSKSYLNSLKEENMKLQSEIKGLITKSPKLQNSESEPVLRNINNDYLQQHSFNTMGKFLSFTFFNYFSQSFRICTTEYHRKPVKAPRRIKWGRFIILAVVRVVKKQKNYTNKTRFFPTQIV
jgi:hypothetical protein